MRKILSLVLSCLMMQLLFAGNMNAEEAGISASTSSLTTVIVIGSGKNKEEALERAFHKAVENVTGAWVWGVTEVDKGRLIRDQIFVHVKGFVKDHSIIEEKTLANGDIVLTVKIAVDTTPLLNILRDAKMVTRDVIIGDIAKIKQTQERLKKSAQFLKEYIGEPAEFIRNAYNLDYVGYEIKELNVDSVKGSILVRLSLNEPWWDGYGEILQQIGQDKSDDALQVSLFDWKARIAAPMPNIDEEVKKYSSMTSGVRIMRGDNVEFEKRVKERIEKYTGKEARRYDDVATKEPKRYFIAKSLEPYLHKAVALEFNGMDNVRDTGEIRVIKGDSYKNNLIALYGNMYNFLTVSYNGFSYKFLYEYNSYNHIITPYSSVTGEGMYYRVLSLDFKVKNEDELKKLLKSPLEYGVKGVFSPPEKVHYLDFKKAGFKEVAR